MPLPFKPFVAAVPVVVADAAFAGVLPCAREADAAVDRLDRLAAERAVAHRGGVHARARAEGVLALPVGPEHLARGAVVLLVVMGRRGGGGRHREGAVADDDVPGRLLEVVVRAEAEVVVLLLGGRVEPAALVSVSGGGSGKVSFYSSYKWQVFASGIAQLPFAFDLSTSIFARQGGLRPIVINAAAGLDGTLAALATPSSKLKVSTPSPPRK